MKIQFQKIVSVGAAINDVEINNFYTMTFVDYEIYFPNET